MNTLKFILFFSLNWALRLVGIVFVALFILAIFSEIATYRKKKEVKTKNLWISIALSVIVLFIFKWVGGVNLAGKYWWLNYLIIPAIGVVIGFVYANTKKLSKEGDKILSQGNIWYLMFWGITTALLQLMFLLGIYQGFTIVVYALLLSTSILVGNNLMLILKVNSLKGGTPQAASPPPTSPSKETPAKK